MRSARPTISPACGPPTSLSPLNVTRSAPAARRSAGVGSWASPNAAGLEQRPAPEVVDDDRAVLVGEPGDLDRIGRLDEPGLREVRRVDAQDDRRPPVRERRLEVGGASPVGRADLDQARARSPDDLRDAHATADLDQLAARDRDPVLAGQPDREHERRGVVDRDERVLGAGQGDEVVLDGPEPRAATTGLAVELEQRIAAGGSRRRLDRGRRATAPGRGSCGGSPRSR